jgi:hypothetical protein
MGKFNLVEGNMVRPTHEIDGVDVTWRCKTVNCVSQTRGGDNIPRRRGKRFGPCGKYTFSPKENDERGVKKRYDTTINEGRG